MEELWSSISSALGLELEGEDLRIGHMSLRAVVVLVLSILMVRLGDKRFMGKSTAFDVFLGIVFGS